MRARSSTRTKCAQGKRHSIAEGLRREAPVVRNSCLFRSPALGMNPPLIEDHYSPLAADMIFVHISYMRLDMAIIDAPFLTLGRSFSRNSSQDYGLNYLIFLLFYLA